MIACLAALAPLAQDPMSIEDVRWLALADRAWRISEPRMIMPQVREVDHADNGAFTLAARGGPWTPDGGRKAELAVISWPAGRAAKVLDLAPGEVMSGAAWSIDASLAGVHLLKPDGSARLLLLDPATGRWSSSAIARSDWPINGGPGAIMARSLGEKGEYVLRIATRARPELTELPELNRLLRSGWKILADADGLNRPLIGSGTMKLAVDAAAMKLSEPAPTGPPAAPPLAGISLSVFRSDDGHAGVLARDLKSDHGGQPAPDPRRPVVPQAPISRDAVWAAMSAGDQPVYVSDGVLFARQIQASPYDEFLAIHKAAVKDQAIQHAKQAGLSLHIYASDYDGLLPSGDVSGRLMPYVQSKDVLNGISWTNVNGQSLDRMINPAQTELGYLGTPFGDAVIFADGHVIWRDRK